MVKRFQPEVETKYYSYEEYPSVSAVMHQSKDGNWLKYETYRDTIAQITKQLNSFKMRLTMNKTHIPFPSIGQYRDAIKQVVDSAKYHNVAVPSVSFVGTVKMHGTNAGVIVYPTGDVQFQSRERIITPESDNAGFATWAHQHIEYFQNLAKEFSTTETVQIFGEWCGGNIQKGVGLNQLPKMFVIFGVKLGSDAESQNWIPMPDVAHAMNVMLGKTEGIYNSYDFPTFFMTIDFSKPEQYQNSLQELTLAVEADCPVARKLLPEATEPLVGEGIVWEATNLSALPFDLSGLRMKIKGFLHSSSKVKTLAAVDTDKVNSIYEFVEYACTVSKSGLTIKDVGGKISAKARNFFMSVIQSEVGLT